MNQQNDLIGGVDESDLAELLLRGDRITQAQLTQLLGGDEVSRIVAESARDRVGALEAGLMAPPNPALPEIVLLHGITDCHLANTAGRHNRIWLDFIELMKGRFTKYLTLMPDGVSDRPGAVMRTDGHVGKKYDRALHAWTAAGFRNQVFCYDWRRSVRMAADELNQFLRGLASIQNGEKVVLVCHSMGGLVAATFAARQPEWKKMVGHCVFVGSPLGGSYSVPMAVLGNSPSFQKMERLSVFEDLEDFQRMAASFPGLIDMLPNPEVLPEAADFYTQAGWPGKVKPAQAHLDASRELKGILWNSPIIAKATHLVSQGHDTTAEMPWAEDGSARISDIVSREGDGGVLTKCSLAPNLPAYLVTGEHGTLVNEAVVYEAVMKIARGESPALPPISAGDLKGETFAAGLEMAAAGLVMTPPEEDRQSRIGETMALRFASEAAVSARLHVVGEPGFSRAALKSEDFSWQNALSMAIASADAYRSDAAEMKERALRDWGFSEYRTFDNDESQGFVCWDDQVVVLSFRGSEQKVADWVRNLRLVPHDTGDSRYGKVHLGFYEGFKRVEAELIGFLHEAGAAQKKLWMTGHSLGAALALVAGAELRELFPAAGFYTYGQPKVGRDKMADFYQKHFPDRFFRFKNNNDIVTRIPPNYDHFGNLFWFDSGGDLKGGAAGGLLAAGALEVMEEQTELSEGEFKAMQEELDRVAEPPADPNLLYLPPADAQVEGLFMIPGFSVSDHSISNQYIPIIRKHLQREQTGQ